MATIADLRRAVKAAGGTLHDKCSARHWRYGAEAPAGFVWNDCDVHELILDQARGPREWLADAIADALERVACGVSPCDDPDCEWCHGGEPD